MEILCLKRQQQQSKRLPFHIYFWTTVVLSLAGLLVAVYLSISHYRVYTDVAYKSFCAISRSINCDTVSQSPFSVFMGIPVPIWGVIGYFFFLLLLVQARLSEAERIRVWPTLFFLSMLFSIYSIILAVISTFLIQSLCIMCIVSYGINFLLLYYTWIARRRFSGDPIMPGLKNDFKFFWQHTAHRSFVLLPFFSAVLVTIIIFPKYWSFEPPRLSADMPVGVTEDGHPWVGAENPRVIITEFTDYQCFQCNKMHFYLRQLMVDHPGKVRVVHRHFPMDHTVNPLVKRPVHVGSGVLALLAIYAGTQDKFWQMSDLLFSIARQMQKIDTRFLAERTGLDARALSRAVRDRRIRSKLGQDIADGLKLGVRGTPTFIVNGTVYKGQIPAQILAKILD
ncbi:MAG: vitamin K epoxide reductase family protein [Desulfobacterales bacterium]|jgi:protein-disulfide isomerase/uncharacterized membrane protein